MVAQVSLPKPNSLRQIYLASGESLVLRDQVAQSGEGIIWRTQQPNLLAKIYREHHAQRTRKLQVMVANPPQDPNLAVNHVSFAWPQALLYDAKGLVIGFLMRAIADSVDLMDVYHPIQRQRTFPRFSWHYLHGTALNIASIVWAIHRAGYVIGDMKPQNILVNSCALPALIDTDSFQVQDPQTQEIFPCRVGSEGYTPPELLSADFETTVQHPHHDLFRLGVIIYQLLMGDQPFKGQWMGKGEAPSPTELLRQGLWPYGQDPQLTPSPLTLPLETVHPALQNCFRRCFELGHTQPHLRPTPQDWVAALKLAVVDLKKCRRVKTHTYSKSFGHCHWCDRAQSLGIDIFPEPSRSTSLGLKKNRRGQQTLHAQNSQRSAQSPSTPATAPTVIQANGQRSEPYPLQTRIEPIFQKLTSLRSDLASWASPLLAWVETTEPETRSPSNLKPGNWKMLSMLSILSLLWLAGLIGLTRSAMTPADLHLTYIGTAFCVVLISACIVMGKLTENQQP